MVETSFVGERPLSYVDDATDDELHILGTAGPTDSGCKQRHVFSDALRINRGEDKGSGINKGRVLGFDTLPLLSPLRLVSLPVRLLVRVN